MTVNNMVPKELNMNHKDPIYTHDCEQHGP